MADLEQQAKEKLWRAQVAAAVDTINAVLALLPPASYTGSKTYDPPSLGTGTQVQTTVTVTGAALGKVAIGAFSLDTQGITLSAVVSAANTVTVTLRNDTGGTLDLASGTLSARTFA